MRLWDNTTLDVVLFAVMRYHIRDIYFENFSNEKGLTK